MRLRRTRVAGVSWLAAVARLTAILTVAAAASPAQVSVNEIRQWSVGDVTRVAVETSGEFRFKYARLSGPDRIYFDILDARQRIAPGNDYSIEVNGPLVKRIRVAQNQRNVVRVVLYLTDRLEVESSTLENPSRLMLEVRGDGTATAVAETTPDPPPARSQPQSNPTSQPVEKPPAVVERAHVSTAPATPPAATPPPPATPPPAETAPSPAAHEPEPEPEPLIATPAQENATGGQSLTRVLGLKLGRVVIDPGHGGRDTGTIGPTGLREKDITLDIARRLAKLIEDGMGSEVVMTRDSDETVGLSARGEIANQQHADLFLSIHVNSSRYRSVSGPETFYLNFTSSRADMEVAARENAGSDKSINELSDLVRKITLDDKIVESADFAASIQAAAHDLAKSRDANARDRGVKKAPFVVLIGTGMPAALVEVGFISNPDEEKLLADPNHRQRIAESLYEGLFDYASTLSHFQVAQSSAD